MPRGHRRAAVSQREALAKALGMQESAAGGSDRGARTVIFSKTKMCKFHILGMCTKGSDCKFAHDKSEMNPVPDLSRTKLCKTLINTGSCTDPECCYAHNREELRIILGFNEKEDLPGVQQDRQQAQQEHLAPQEQHVQKMAVFDPAMLGFFAADGQHLQTQQFLVPQVPQQWQLPEQWSSSMGDVQYYPAYAAMGVGGNATQQQQLRQQPPFPEQQPESSAELQQQPRLVVKNTFYDFEGASGPQATLETRPSTWAYGLNLLAHCVSSESMPGSSEEPAAGADAGAPLPSQAALAPAPTAAGGGAAAANAAPAQAAPRSPQLGAASAAAPGGSSSAALPAASASASAPAPAGLPRRSSKVSFALEQVSEGEGESTEAAGSDEDHDRDDSSGSSHESPEEAAAAAGQCNETAPSWNHFGGGEQLGSARFTVKNTFIEVGEDSASIAKASCLRSVRTAPIALDTMG